MFDVVPLFYSEKAMAPHSSTLVWKTPWTEEPGRQQFMGLLRVGHDRVTSLSLFTFMLWRPGFNPWVGKDPLEKATHSSILAWRIPWTIYPTGSQRVDTTEQLSLHMSSPLCSLSLGPRWTDTHLLEVLTSTRQHPQPLGAGSSLPLQKK